MLSSERRTTKAKPARPSTARTKLREYRRKRHFDVTSEPSGDAVRRKAREAKAHAEASGARSEGQFVVQKHAASHLHYDFRLELDGVLLSWSVPKGPSLAPKTRRLAMRTEDHPLDYADFEGIIPKGEYGGGTVIVWDRGSWTAVGDAREGMKKGNLTFTLDGGKLRGRWHLVRTGGRGNAKSAKEAWLLFKGRDDDASDTRDIVTELPNSIVTERSIDEVASAEDRVWHSNRSKGKQDVRSGAPPSTETRARAKSKTTKSEPGPSASANAPPDIGAMLRSLVSFKLTNLDKVLYPEQGLTKGALFAYVAVVREAILPHVARRPLTLVRCPAGRDKHCFFQKHVKDGGSAIKRIPIEEEDGTVADYLMVDDLEGLLATTQLGALELHTWGSRWPKVEKPDLLVFDLDPDVGLGWEEVVRAAFDLRENLRDIRLESLVKTTGGKGLHVVVPVVPKLDWDTFKAFSKGVVTRMEKAEPERFTTNMMKAKRRGRIFLDYLRNGRGATFIAPYSMRARENATVATPITWEELAKGVDPKTFTILTVPKRLETMKKDPWAAYDSLAKQPISAAALKKVGVR